MDVHCTEVDFCAWTHSISYASFRATSLMKAYRILNPPATNEILQIWQGKLVLWFDGQECCSLRFVSEHIPTCTTCIYIEKTKRASRPSELLIPRLQRHIESLSYAMATYHLNVLLVRSTLENSLFRISGAQVECSGRRFGILRQVLSYFKIF